MALFKRQRKRLKNKIIYIFIRFGFLLVLKMERKTAFKLFEALGRLTYFLVVSERNKTVRHLKSVFGETLDDARIHRMAKEVFINLARNLVDPIQIRKYDSNSIGDIVSAKGLNKIDRLLKDGNGLFLFTGHIGSWELLGAYLALKGYPLHVIGAPSYDPNLDNLIIQNRQKSGAQYIARGANATKKIFRAVRKNEIVGFLIDQDSKKFDGVFVDFMGKEAYTPVGPVLLATKTKAPLLSIAIHMQEDYRHLIEVGEEIELELTDDKERDLIFNTERCSKAIEKFILQHPMQWVWMHKRWKTKRQVQ